ncbi:recombinase family protein [Cellulosilyticum lentocellum]|uniref:Resolvase domain n=1 Tax=Cellulosilyticum lentocellum (strain ATCC 49066 / DSM 5427 / NCIMB 11756 / RHM5) TaxID=642492 RepID=F2JIF5_CELLD|nr:recombinase family protein [Cellulosilyticum lentocellum]ADZ84321.1 Resolvase domain [Cellulosilyticum lentocellum DSM 5427]
MTTYGYARCSTNENKQDINRQKRELKALGCVDEKNIYWEYESGTKVDRVELNKLLDKVKAGDTIVTTEVSRITRSTKQLCEIIEKVKEKQLKLVIGGFVVDCSKGELDAMTDGMLKMMGVFAEMERNMISERVKSGMANAVAKGKVIGRPITTIENLPSSFIKHYPKYRSKEINKSELARICSISRQTVHKYVKVYESAEEK